MDDLYQQQILDHYKNPQNFGELKNADLVLEESNQSCGDIFKFFIKLDSQKQVIQDICFTGTGCAISTAATSLLLEKLKGMSLSQINDLEDPDYMQELIGSKISYTRLKCLTLPARALTSAVNKFHKSAKL